MLWTALIVVVVIGAFYLFMKRSREKFNAEETARMRARARKRWAERLGGKGDDPHEETWVEYQERKRR
jgi:hypothetical protein